jgi:hypothetical protein
MGRNTTPLNTAWFLARICKKDEGKRRRQPDAKKYERLAKDRQSREDKRQEAYFRCRKGHKEAPDNFTAAASGL